MNVEFYCNLSWQGGNFPHVSLLPDPFPDDFRTKKTFQLCYTAIVGSSFCPPFLQLAWPVSNAGVSMNGPRPPGEVFHNSAGMSYLIYLHQMGMGQNPGT